MQKALIYNSKGAGPRSSAQLRAALELCFPELTVAYVSAEEILSGTLASEVGLLCFPGGFDLGFLETLGRSGCDVIRSWVLAGGSYLGICAGAYFAADRIEFDRQGDLEVCGERFLKFYPGTTNLQHLPLSFSPLFFASSIQKLSLLDR